MYREFQHYLALIRFPTLWGLLYIEGIHWALLGVSRPKQSTPSISASHWNPWGFEFAVLLLFLLLLLLYPRGSIYATIMELGPQNHNGDGLLGPNSRIVVYMDTSGYLLLSWLLLRLFSLGFRGLGSN